jgi:hypothetical protein
MQLKIEKYNPDNGITFLARVFPDPANSLTSFQDPLRTMRKLHLTSRNPTVPLQDAAKDRVEGYLVTDRHTPIIAAYCRLVARSYAGTANRGTRLDRNLDKPYWTLGEHTGNCWPQLPDDNGVVHVVFANRIGCSVDNVMKYTKYLDGLQDVWDAQPLFRGVDVYPYAGTILEDGTVCPIPEGIEKRDKNVMLTNDIKRTTDNSNRRPDANFRDHGAPESRRRDRPIKPPRPGRMDTDGKSERRADKTRKFERDAKAYVSSCTRFANKPRATQPPPPSFEVSSQVESSHSSRNNSNSSYRVGRNDSQRTGDKRVIVVPRQRTHGVVEHYHVCDSCGRAYYHTHAMTNADHRQFPNQCPNAGCEWFMGPSIVKNARRANCTENGVRPHS